MTKRIKVTPLTDFGRKVIEQNGEWWNTQRQNYKETGRPARMFAISEKTGVGRYLPMRDFKFKMPTPKIPQTSFDLMEFLTPIAYHYGERARAGVNTNEFSKYEYNGKTYGEIFIDTSSGNIIVEIPSSIQKTTFKCEVFDVYGNSVKKFDVRQHFHKIGFRNENNSIEEWLNEEFATDSLNTLRLVIEISQDDAPVVHALRVRKTLTDTNFVSSFDSIGQRRHDKVEQFYGVSGKALTFMDGLVDSDTQAKIEEMRVMSFERWHQFTSIGAAFRSALTQAYKQPVTYNYL